MKRFLLSILCCLLAVVNGYAEEETATLSFANKAQRKEFTTSKQVWEQNGVVLTNNKSSSTNNVADYANPARFYANSEIIVDCSSLGNITEIVFMCNSTTYASTLKTSIGDEATASGSNVTVTLSTPVKIYKIAKLTGQVRLNSLTVTYQTGTTVEPPTISFVGDGNFDSSIEVTISAAEGTTARYTLNGMNPDLSSDKCPETLTLKADATLKVIAYDEAENASSVVKQEFKLQSSGESGGAAGTATLVTDVTELAVDDQVIIVASNSNVALSTNQKDNNRGQVAITKDGDDVVLNDDVQILTLKEGTAENSFAFYTGSGYLFSASSSANQLKTQKTHDKNSSWGITIDDGVATIKTKGNYTRNWLRYNSSSALFACYSGGQADVSLYKVNPVNYEDYVLKVTKAGWATLYLGYNVTIPEGVTCYVISAVTAESAILTKVEGDVLPANTGAIIKADEGEYTFAVSTDEATVVSKLDGTIKNEYITNEAYVLGLDEDGEVGLYKAKMAGGVFLNNANKAYLPESAVSGVVQGANGFKFRFETTGIEGVSAVKGEKVIFDLAGRKLNDMSAPGIYIVNGKKVMVK